MSSFLGTSTTEKDSEQPSNFLSFREFETITEGYLACESEGTKSLPFVVRASSLALSGVYKGDTTSNSTSWPSLEQIRKQLSREADIKGYVGKKNTTIHMNGKDTLASYDDLSLQHNVVDSESTRSSTSLLSSEMIAISSESRVDRENWLAYVVSPASNKCGQLHTDPPHGSNWQYLSSGSKIWYCINVSTFDVKVYDVSITTATAATSIAATATVATTATTAATATVATPPDMEALSLLHDCYRTTINPGDFVSVPIYWAHSINTKIASIGLSGYTAIPTSMLSPRNSEDGSAQDY